MALRAATVEVDRDVGAAHGGHGKLGRVDDLVDCAGEPRDRRERGGRRQDGAMTGERVAQGAQCRQRGQQVAEAEWPVGDQQRPAHGQDGSLAGTTTSSRSSQPAGWRSANTTLRATSAGSLSCWSGAGLKSSGRSSKKCVLIPPGISNVTPTRSPSSTASARVKPTTPNLLAQYAVAAGSARSPSVDATVTTRPRDRSSAGRAARTTAAVPSRLTAMTRSHASGSTSRMSPHASMPAAVTTASSPSCSSTTARTAASASRPCARSTWRNAKPFDGGRRSSTTAVPPSALTAAAIAAPSPDAPPVIRTVPTGSSGTGENLLDQSGRRAAGHVRHDDGAPVPFGERLRLRQIGDGVVAALRPQVRAQLAQDRARVVLVEHDDRVDAAQRREHGD